MTLSLRNYYLDAIGIPRWRLRPQELNTVDSSVANEAADNPVPENISWYIYGAPPEVVFLAEILNPTERELLTSIMRACAKDRIYALGKMLSLIEQSQWTTILSPQCRYLLVFGKKQAQYLDATFTQPGLYAHAAIKIYVTDTLAELQANPALKRELWQQWQKLM